MIFKTMWNVYRTRFLVRARQLNEPLVFTDSLGREHSGQPGDYLVETSDGIRRITSQKIFEDIYVPLGQLAPPAPRTHKRSTAAVVTARTSSHAPASDSADFGSRATA